MIVYQSEDVLGIFVPVDVSVPIRWNITSHQFPNLLLSFFNRFTYQSEADLGGSTHAGELATYSGGGYVQNLGKTKSVTQETIEYLFTESWITRGTRALFIDFTVYNANVNLFCVIRLVVEFPATAGAISSWSFRTVKLLRYVTVFEHFVMACEFFFALFILYYIIEELIEVST